MPFFSIVIPTLNSEKTISYALESILQQIFKDFEVLIMDGLSTDNTIILAQRFNDERIRIYSEKDKGVYDAMNKGIKLSMGEVIYFLGSDDQFINPEVLKIINKTMISNGCDVLYGNVISSRFKGRYDFEFDYDMILEKNICHQAIFFKRNIFKITGLFNLKYKVLSDWDHNMKWLLNHQINKTYIELDIANFTDGGLSLHTFDENFDQDKTYNYLKYGRWLFSYQKSKQLIYQIGTKSIESKNIKRILNLGLLTIIVLIHTIMRKLA